MARPKQLPEEKKKRPPARTPEARENQIIALAYDLAEKQISNGTASSQVLSHFLKQGTIKTQLELEKMKAETSLLQKKEESLAQQGRIEELYKDALNAMKTYSGNGEGSGYND